MENELSMPDTAIRIDISLTPGEKKLESDLLKKPDFRLTAPSGFDLPIAWELANLTRIAYKDYEVFNEETAGDGPKQPRRALKAGSCMVTSNKICQEVIDSYLIADSPRDSAPASAGEGFGEGYFQYNVCSVYTYLAYTTGAPPKPDVDRFGFVAQRKQVDGSILTYIVFRGTREPEEWFNNFQFKQVPFLMRSQED